MDKTEYIYNLINNEARVFISRPRRFGKSLTLDTIATLFETGVEPYFKGKADVTDDQGKNLLEEGTVDDIINLFNSALNSVSYDNYPIVSESSVQNMLKLYLLGAHQKVLSEVHEAKGRADLVVNTDNRRIVFEFKYAKNETEAKSKLLDAVEQIKTRDYGNIVPNKTELLRIAAVFNADPKVRAFTEYQEV